VKDQLARRARGVYKAMTDRPKSDTAIAQLFDKLDQVMHGEQAQPLKWQPMRIKDESLLYSTHKLRIRFPDSKTVGF
jgi:hypothetical protein